MNASPTKLSQLAPPQQRGESVRGAADLGDGVTLRQVMAHYPTGVAVISYKEEGAIGALVVGTVLRASDEPPLIGFMAMHASRRWSAIRNEFKEFCVNVVGDHQEQLCRELTRGDEQTLRSERFFVGERGIPALLGATAHVYCAVEQITPVGDHDFVLGEVIAARNVSAAGPMVYLQGSYGRIAQVHPLAGREEAGSQYAGLDLCRGELSELARRTGRGVSMEVLDEADIVLISTVGATESGDLKVRVGQRLPFAAPFGSIHAAFGDEATKDRWLNARLTTTRTREENLRTLERVRARGYMIALNADEHGSIAAAAQRLARANPSARKAEYEQLRRFDGSYNPPAYREASQYGDEFSDHPIDVRQLAAPVYGSTGALTFGLTVWGTRSPVTVIELQSLISETLRVAERCTARLSGFSAM